MLAKRWVILPLTFGVASLGFFLRGASYYPGPGPRDGEDLPSYVMFVTGSLLLVGAVLSSWSRRIERRRRWKVSLYGSTALLLIASAWWWFNVMLANWAS
jgi:hypothetical protein